MRGSTQGFSPSNVTKKKGGRDINHVQIFGDSLLVMNKMLERLQIHNIQLGEFSN
jgi:hypothetical protein